MLLKTPPVRKESPPWQLALSLLHKLDCKRAFLKAGEQLFVYLVVIIS
jgi:hypothetical protein